MGDIADGLLDGQFDFYTGEYLGQGCGYPRTFDRSLPWERARSNKPSISTDRAGAKLIGCYVDVEFKNHFTGAVFQKRCKVLGYNGKKGQRWYRVEIKKRTGLGTGNIKFHQIRRIYES